MNFNKNKYIVVKAGTNILTNEDNLLDLNNLREISRQIAKLKKKGYKIILVTSGAIVTGSEHIGKKPKNLIEKQAAAAVGQSLLMNEYSNFFEEKGIVVAQILLTRDIFINNNSLKNARNTIITLVKNNIVPIINENDTVAVEEIKFGDNDELSALVAKLIEAGLLIILTDTDGLHTSDPGSSKKAVLIKKVNLITSKIEKLAGKESGRRGTGGMVSKIKAAKDATQNGIPVIIAYGREKNVLERILSGEEIGTYFVARKSKKQ